MRTRSSRRARLFLILLALSVSLPACGSVDAEGMNPPFLALETLEDAVVHAPDDELVWGSYGTLVSATADGGELVVDVTRTSALEGVEMGSSRTEEVSARETFVLGSAPRRCGFYAPEHGFAVPAAELVPGSSVLVWGSGSPEEGVVSLATFENLRYCAYPQS